MYQVIEYNDYRKENYIILHGVTSDLEKAKQRARDILEKDASGYNCYEEASSFYQIYQLDTEDHPNQYVQLQPGNKKSVMCEYTFRFIEFSELLKKTVGELYRDILDEKVPKSVSPDQIITKELFRDLVENKNLSKFLDFLREDIGDIEIDTFSTIVSIVKCEEF